MKLIIWTPELGRRITKLNGSEPDNPETKGFNATY